MTVYVDADGCPVITNIEKICKKHNTPLVIMCDTNHIFSSDYAQVITISAGCDAVDFALINRCASGDIVVTQDYGVAAMALSKSSRLAAFCSYRGRMRSRSRSAFCDKALFLFNCALAFSTRAL